VTESDLRRSGRTERWDARFRLASFPFLVRPAAWLLSLALIVAPIARLHAQGPAPRPWLDWHTTRTEHFVFHYPTAYRDWTFALADRIESLRTEVADVVGFTPRNRVHIVVDDPVNDANGYAFTALDAPTIVLWPVSPDPRSDIGDYAVWQELLATRTSSRTWRISRGRRAIAGNTSSAASHRSRSVRSRRRRRAG
jgi:hypothetical protein